MIIVENSENRSGLLLRITKLANGILKNIIVPRDHLGWGWRKMVDCLDNSIGKRFWKMGDNRKRTVERN